ncbi:cytochrome c oxidase assembly protein [Cytobacillus horneckiae]|uniref:Cytochrome c oxidase assembly protein n=1 Tax=Cytobacillus horneckiae TaxID=549687 RepID=A0A2N0ZA02_9BACI|nr:cytochrome c oxidase assembly protein [Cytobacillus horneckiae]MEC1158471.1 cytochrome c oxidase assembly protein [Cytobacillus horneckiae]MED2939574.1 cytochrome c oxidase assembly protein [Cytobacillus horneckiae]PKG26329.1 cytochrome c oxidase assembly protein [Cytobacillus horneckiae]
MHALHHLEPILQLILAIPFVFLIVIYKAAVMMSNRRYSRWPWYRTACWTIGNLFCLLAVAGPLAEAAHQDFRIHMIGHLLLGMAGPLLMVLSKPVSLLLRSIPIRNARRITAVLRKKFFHALMNPLLPALLNIGGLWVLYKTDLFVLMHHSMWLYAIIHAHIFLAGYFFTASIIYIDKTPYGYSFVYRAIILILALAGHQILAKSLYAYPPDGVPITQAEAGSMIMYYGGDAVDLVIIIIFCYQWYKAAKPRKHHQTNTLEAK